MRRTLEGYGRAAAAVLAALSGCSGIPTSGERRAREDLAAAAAAYRPDDEQAPLPVLTERSALADLLRYALLGNPQVRAAFYEWKAAVEAITVARSLPDPMVTLSAEIGDKLEALTPMLMTDTMSNWPWPEKLGLAADAAAAEARRGRFRFDGAMLATALGVKRVYYELAVLEEETRLTRDAVALLDDAERLARQRLAVGGVTQQDALRAQIERDTVRAALGNMEDARGPLEARLRSALGMRFDEPLPPLAFSLAGTDETVDEEALLEAARARNPRLAALRSEVEQALALYQLASLGWVPGFSFGLGADVKSSPVMWMPTFGVTLPIWRDKIAAEIDRTRAAAGAAAARVDAEELDLAVRFAEAFFAWREADRNATLYGESLVPKAEAAVAAARAGYAGGLTSFLDLIEGERTVLEFRRMRARALGQRAAALAELSIAIAGARPQGLEDLFSPSPGATAVAPGDGEK